MGVTRTGSAVAVVIAGAAQTEGAEAVTLEAETEGVTSIAETGVAAVQTGVVVAAVAETTQQKGGLALLAGTETEQGEVVHLGDHHLAQCQGTQCLVVSQLHHLMLATRCMHHHQLTHTHLNSISCLAVLMLLLPGKRGAGTPPAAGSAYGVTPHS